MAIINKIRSFWKSLSGCNCFLQRTDSDTVDPQAKIKSPSHISQHTSRDASPKIGTSKHKETIVIIAHGAFQTVWHYQSYMDALQGYTDIDHAICPQQTSSNSNPATGSFESDIRLLNTTIIEELKQNHDVLLVCHSYGGIPGCEALRSLPPPVDGSIGSVLGIVFVSAFVAEKGQSLVTSKMAGRASWVRVEGQLSYVNYPVQTLYSSVQSPSFAQELADRLVPQASQSFLTATEQENWKKFPCYYVRCLQDRAMVPEEQDYFIHRLKQNDPDTVVKELQSDHAPFACVPKRMAELTEEIVHELRNRDTQPKKLDPLLSESKTLEMDRKQHKRVDIER